MLTKIPIQILTVIVQAASMVRHRLMDIAGNYAAIGERVFGVLDGTDISSGYAAPVITKGVAIVEAAEVIAIGDLIISSGDEGKGAVAPPKSIYDILAEALSWSSDTTLSEVFSFAAKAGAVYSGKIFLIGTNAHTSAASIKYQFTLPSGATIFITAAGTEKDNSSAITEELPANGTEEVIELDVLITIGSTAGTVTLLAAQNASNAAAIALAIGSYQSLKLANPESFVSVGYAISAATGDGVDFRMVLD